MLTPKKEGSTSPLPPSPPPVPPPPASSASSAIAEVPLRCQPNEMHISWNSRWKKVVSRLVTLGSRGGE